MWYDKTMKIAIFSDCYLDLTGGIVSVINIEKAELEKRGHEVKVFSSAYPHSEKEIKEFDGKNIFPVPSCKVFGRGATPIARRPKIIEKWLLKNHPELKDFDIFYVHYEAGCSIAGLRLAKKLHIPAVQVMHGREDMGEENLIPKGFRTFVAKNLNRFHSWYLPHNKTVARDNYLATTTAKSKMWTMMVNHADYADLIITPSEHFKEKLIYYGVKKKIVALHHGLASEKVTVDVKPKELKFGETLNIIWHSRISGEKRPMEFLKALDILQTKYGHKNYKLDAYGPGPDLERAKKYAKDHYLHVTFHGPKPFDEIWQTMQKAHLDVLVSYNYDTFGMTLIEAEAAGIPSFFVDKDMEEILPEGSYVLASGPSPEAMASALNELLEHPERITKMSETLLKDRKRLDIKNKIDELEKIFKELKK